MIGDLEDWIFTKKLSPRSFIGRIDTGLYYGGEEFTISLSTVYRHINKGIISVDFADLIHKLNCKPRKNRVVKRIPKMIKGTSIEERPDDINNRTEFGYWEGKINDMPRKVLDNYFSPNVIMWFQYNRYDDYPYFLLWSITEENIGQLRKYGKAHIVYSPTKYKWVVSDKFRQ